MFVLSWWVHGLVCNKCLEISIGIHLGVFLLEGKYTSKMAVLSKMR